MKKYSALRFLPISPNMIDVKTLIKTTMSRVEHLIFFPFNLTPNLKAAHCPLTLPFSPPSHTFNLV